MKITQNTNFVNLDNQLPRILSRRLFVLLFQPDGGPGMVALRLLDVVNLPTHDEFVDKKNCNI